MTNISDRRPFSSSPTVKRFVAVLVVAIAAILLLKFADGLMYDDPLLSPPTLQIRNQNKQLGAQINSIVVPNDDVGFTLPPELDQTVQTYDFTFHRITDERGFPNAGTWPDSADIVFLGDSLLMGEGVGVEHGFVSLIDQTLKEKSIVNLGNPGAGPERQSRLFRQFGADLQPKLVVACLYLASDLMGDIHFDAWLNDPIGKTYNDFRLGYARRYESRSRKSFISRMQSRPLYYWAQSVVEPRLPDGRKILHELAMRDGAILFFDRDQVEFAKRHFSETDKEIVLFSESLRHLQAIAAQQDISLVFVLIPSKEEVFAVDIMGRADTAVELVKLALEGQNVPYLDLYPILREHGQARTPYYSRDIHLNEYGNSLVAEVISRWVESIPGR
ncbi:MAG: hypothetical protein HQ492_02410 [Woeseiaceae bacterium]|nr:hypothetical protein [Woeseiaceae bacterium]